MIPAIIPALTAILCLPAHGGTIQVTNFAESPLPSVAVGGALSSTYIATSFLTGSQEAALQGAAALVRNPGTTALTVELSLWTNGANQPGTRVYVFPDTLSLPIGAGNTWFESTASGVSLASNTAYWLALRGTAGDGLSWVGTTSSSESSPSGWSISDSNPYLSHDSGGTWTMTGTGTVIPILEIQAAPVPEPGSFLLAIAGIAAGAVFLRKRRKENRP